MYQALIFFYFPCLAEFRFLKRLILVHGRYSYNRTAFLSQYSFYKSLLICFIQILWVSLVMTLYFSISFCPLLENHCPKILCASIFSTLSSYWYTNIRHPFSFSFISGVSGTSLFNSVSLMAYNVFYTSIPVLVSVLDKDLSEKTVMRHPQILFYCQAGRLGLLFFLFSYLFNLHLK